MIGMLIYLLYYYYLQILVKWCLLLSKRYARQNEKFRITFPNISWGILRIASFRASKFLGRCFEPQISQERKKKKITRRRIWRGPRNISLKSRKHFPSIPVLCETCPVENKHSPRADTNKFWSMFEIFRFKHPLRADTNKFWSTFEIVRINVQ